MLSRGLERSSKALVLISTFAALLVETLLASRGWSLLLPWTAAAFGAGLLLTRWRRRWAWAALLAILTLWPAIQRGFLGRHLDAYWAIWMGGCLGALLADQRSLQWSTPPLWRVPLAYWALAVSLVWPFIALREMDFSWQLINVYHISNSYLGGPPPVLIVWILLVALTHLLGLLWFENACRHNDFDDPLSFIRWTVVPLACGAALGCALAVYQGTVNVDFLNGHQWPAANRAGGSLLDGDAFGTLAAAWMVWFAALAFCFAGRSRLLVLAAGISSALALGGMWASGSRIAFAGTAVGSLFLLAASGRALMRLQPRHRLALGAVAVLLVLAVIPMRHRFETFDPFSRTMATLPKTMTWPAIRAVAVNQLWDRDAPFGTVAVKMLREFPLTGVGIGSFNHLFVDFSLEFNPVHLTADSAQSWYRHHLAEMGWLASLGWIFWVGSFGWILLRAKGAPPFRDAATLVKGGLCVVAAVSLVAMPTQSFAFSFSIWVMAAWFLHLSPDARQRANVGRIADAPWAWLACWTFVLVFVGATAWVAWTRLRPPVRAVVAEWSYQYGFSELETPPDLPPVRWMQRSAVSVFPVTGAWLKLTVLGASPDITANPVRLIVRRQDNKKIVNVAKMAAAPETWYVQPPANAKQMMLQFEASRDHALAVADWTFVDAPPRGAVLIRQQ